MVSKLLEWQTERPAGFLQLLQGRTDSVMDVSFPLTYASRCFGSLKGYCPHIMACLREPCPSAWMLNQNAFSSGPCPPADGYRKEKINTFLPGGWPFQEIVVRLMVFFTLHHHFPHHCSIKEPGIQTLIRWLFQDISLPSSGSAGFLNKVTFLAPTPHLSVNWPVVWWAEWVWTQWHNPFLASCSRTPLFHGKLWTS